MKNGAFNTTIAADGEESSRVLTKAEAIPLPVDCNIHPFMHGCVLVKDDPYMAASAADGTFEIKNVPAGKHEFEFWHEQPGRLEEAEVPGRRAEPAGPGHAHDRRRPDARPRRDQGPGEHVEVTLSVVSS